MTVFLIKYLCISHTISLYRVTEVAGADPQKISVHPNLTHTGKKETFQVPQGKVPLSRQV